MVRYLAKVILLLNLISLPVWATEPMKIGVVDWQGALHKTKIWQDADTQFRKDYAKEFAAIQSVDSELKALYEKKDKVAKTEFDGIVKQIKAKTQTRNEVVKKLDFATQQRMHELEQVVQPKLNTIFKEVAEKNGYDMLIDRSVIPYFKSDKDDMTQAVVEKMNQTFAK
jgi:Skp family chaperone for outer membrane proteins